MRRPCFTVVRGILSRKRSPDAFSILSRGTVKACSGVSSGILLFGMIKAYNNNIIRFNLAILMPTGKAH